MSKSHYSLEVFRKRPPPSPWPGFVLPSAILFVIVATVLPVTMSTECWRQRLPGRPNFWLGHFNHTIKCPMNFQWTVADFCCYETYDRDLRNPFCCYSEVYKLAVAVGFICLILLGTSFCIFFCWFYNLPHHLLYLITFKKFRLNDWMAKAKNGPYVDPSFYSGEPFWARGANFLPYPLRPMPPRIFYPAPPANMKFRWDMNHGDMPLFVLASRQFHRNPYSARPHDRTPPTNPAALPSSNTINESRRSSITSLADRKDSSAHQRGSSGHNNGTGSNQNQQNPRLSISSASGQSSGQSHNHNHTTQNQHQNSSSNNNSSFNYPSASQYSVPFVVNINEEEAASELLEALKILDEKDDPNDKSISTTDISSSKALTSSLSSATSISPTSPSMQTFSISHENGSIFVTSTSRDFPSTSFGGSRGERMIMNMNSTSGGGGSNSSPILGKVSLESLNQQLSSSLSLSIANLPSCHVIGNFGGGGNQMETIVEDEAYDDDSDYSQSRPASRKDLPGTPRISSALDRIVTRARQEIPFKPSLPGAIPENPEGEGSSSKTNRLSRRNSAPVNC